MVKHTQTDELFDHFVGLALKGLILEEINLVNIVVIFEVKCYQYLLYL